MQFTLFGKDESGKVIPVANICKDEQDNEFSLHINYDQFIKKLPQEYQEIIYLSYIPKKDLENIL